MLGDFEVELSTPPCLSKAMFSIHGGVYPEDHWIDASQIRCWVGEGFIKPKRGLILEEVAEDYLEDLIDRNLVLVRTRRWNGKAEYCVIHDAVRELCVKVGKKEKFIGVVEVPQLRHLQLNHLHLPDPLPSDGSKQEECIILRNLHTLLGVVGLKLTEEVCKRIPNIKKLKLVYQTLPEGDGEKEASSSYYCLHNLGRLSKLESLQCYFGEESKWRYVFQSLTIFPSSLVELTLSNCHWEDLTKMIKSIPQLRCLELWFVSGSEWDLAEEEFPHLRILKIRFPYELIDWNASSYNFPVLEELGIFYFHGTSKLREIPFDLGEIPTLRLIHLTGCSAFCALSAMRIAVEQGNLGNQDMQLEVSFYGMEEEERFRQMMGEEGLISDSLSLYHKLDKMTAFF